MKKIIIIISLFTIPLPLFALIGRCIDNSKYLQERYDDKKYHFVTCYCNCADTLKICPSCGHKHMARKQIIVSTPQHDIAAKTSSTIKKKRPLIQIMDPHIALTALVKNSKRIR